MTTWSLGASQSEKRHGFKNAIAGMPSLCGTARFPDGGPLRGSTRPYCAWCSDKARPPEAPNTGGMHAKGQPWAIEGRWIRPKQNR